MDSSDLSEYEIVRQKNINRNMEFLSQLGLSNQPHHQNPTMSTIRTNSDRTSKKRRKESVTYFTPQSSSSTRQLRSHTKIDDIPLIETVAPDIPTIQPFSYEDLPSSSEELDDFEFQVFVKLKSWRLKMCRELETEAYKICQNRTIIELIRRRRNKKDWARSDSDSSKMCEDLLECWGLGPAKVVLPDGFGVQLIKELDADVLNESLLEQSRSITITPDAQLIEIVTMP